MTHEEAQEIADKVKVNSKNGYETALFNDDMWLAVKYGTMLSVDEIKSLEPTGLQHWNNDNIDKQLDDYERLD